VLGANRAHQHEPDPPKRVSALRPPARAPAPHLNVGAAAPTTPAGTIFSTLPTNAHAGRSS